MNDSILTYDPKIILIVIYYLKYFEKRYRNYEALLMSYLRPY